MYYGFLLKIQELLNVENSEYNFQELFQLDETIYFEND